MNYQAEDAIESPAMDSFCLTGEIRDEQWFASADEALAAYNRAVETHNANCRTEKDKYAFVDRLSYQCWEFIGDGVTRYQWPNPQRNHGTLYLEVMESDEGR